MRTTKYVLFAALGVAALLLLTSDKAKEMRDSLDDKAKRNAKKWKSKLYKIGNDATDTVADLKELFSNEIEGISDDARERIENILDGTAGSADRLRKNINRQLS